MRSSHASNPHRNPRDPRSICSRCAAWHHRGTPAPERHQAATVALVHRLEVEMNHIINDRGKVVLGVGNEISPAYMAAKYPAMIETLASMTQYELTAVADAVTEHKRNHCTVPTCRNGKTTDGYDSYPCWNCGGEFSIEVNA